MNSHIIRKNCTKTSEIQIVYEALSCPDAEGIYQMARCTYPDSEGCDKDIYIAI